jgi:hypothetical protein
MPRLIRTVRNAANHKSCWRQPQSSRSVNMSETEFRETMAMDKARQNDAIDRATAAIMLGISTRTLLRWEHRG